MAKRLALDLGPNSIGWALLGEGEILGTGVRVFQEGLANFDTSKEVSLNEQRRSARMMRRQKRRRSQRRDSLLSVLIEAGLFPEDREQQRALYSGDPYELRAKGLDERLEPGQIGRVILHLSRHRGFWSPRKGAAKNDDSEILQEISELKKAIEDAGCRTLGEYLFRKVSEQKHAERSEDDHVRNRHTHRGMLEEEFLLIWKKQAEHYPDLLSEERCFGAVGQQSYPRKPISRHHLPENKRSLLDAFGVHGITFFQRPIYWPVSSIGLCELEPKQRRYPKAHRLTEWFRVLQEVNNIRYVDTDTGEECSLSSGQRSYVLNELSQKRTLTFKAMKKGLSLPEDTPINLENGGRKNLKGMTTDYEIAKAIGKEWHHRDVTQKNQIVELLLNPEITEDALLNQLIDRFDFDVPRAETLLSVDLPSGYGNLSKKALEKLIPFLEQGMIYMGKEGEEGGSALHAAGYLRRDQLQRRIFDSLPHPDRMSDCPIGDIPNPVVKRALMQLRKVVNAIIREYGKPDEIFIEMARQMQLGAKKRKELNIGMRQREEDRDEAAALLRSQNLRVSRDSILRVCLWQQQGESCLYCGQKISLRQLLGGEADIDHILPISLSHDDSQSNKVICHRRCNHEKGQRTVYEWVGESQPERYEEILQFAKSLLTHDLLPYTKYKKLLRKHVDSDEFLARQLVDTGYITKAAAEYLRCLVGADHHVLGVKGKYTHALRHEWGLNTLLEEFSDSPAWIEANTLHAGEKNRADHRHHALDAIVIGLTDRPTIQKLSSALKNRREGRQLELDAPWDNFRESVRHAIESINVSRQVNRGISGSLHEDTFYGPVHEGGQLLPGTFVVRKPLTELTANEIPQIRDITIRQQVIAKLREAGIEVGRGKKFSREQKARCVEILAKMTMESGVPIKKVRILKAEQTIQPIRQGKPSEAWVKPGNMHHLCIFKWIAANGQEKRDAVFVTMLEAKKRQKLGQPLIQRTPPQDHPTIPADAEFVMSLANGELVQATLDDGSQQLWTFKTAASTQGQIYFALNTDARRSGDQKKIAKMANTLKAQKVTVDLLGRVRWAND